jgi:peptidoglycan-N-acetylglucosamine deacetylase
MKNCPAKVMEPVRKTAKFAALAATAISLSVFGMACRQKQTNENGSAVLATEKNEAAAPKTIKLPAEKLDSGAKVVYLTFDDGPLPGSEAINKLSLEHKFKGSVFVVGKHTTNGKTSLRTLRDYKRNPYLDVCNHSYTHANMDYKKFYADPEGAAADLRKNQEDLKLDLKIIRLPGSQLWALPTRDFNLKVQKSGPTAEILKTEGYKIYGWDVEWGQKGTAPKETAEEIAAKIDEQFAKERTWTRNHLVVLTHDVMFSKPDGQAQLVKLVEMLRAKKYVLENIRHYPEKDAGDDSDDDLKDVVKQPEPVKQPEAAVKTN